MDDTTHRNYSLHSNDLIVVITINLYLLLIHIKQQFNKLITVVKIYIWDLTQKTFKKLPVPYSIDRILAFSGTMARTIEEIAKVNNIKQEKGSHFTSLHYASI